MPPSDAATPGDRRILAVPRRRAGPRRRSRRCTPAGARSWPAWPPPPAWPALLTGRGAWSARWPPRPPPPSSGPRDRVAPPRTGVVLAAADGTVATIGEVLPPAGAGPAARPGAAGQRLPVRARRARAADPRRRAACVAVEYRPGHVPVRRPRQGQRGQRAQRDAAARPPAAHRVGVVQIAGLLARRIVCEVGPGDEVAAGETYGLIRFGSRVDTYLPPGSTRRGRGRAAHHRRGDGAGRAARPTGRLMAAVPAYPPGSGCCPTRSPSLALCSGLSAVYFALSGRFELSVAAAGIAALCDALDGRLARMLDASTRIGAELDSLSDLVVVRRRAGAGDLHLGSSRAAASAGPSRSSSRSAWRCGWPGSTR